MTKLESIIEEISQVGRVGICTVEVADRTPVHIVQRMDSPVPKMLHDERMLEYTITVQVFPNDKAD